MNILLDNIRFEKYTWLRIPDTTNRLLFRNCFQHRFSKIDSISVVLSSFEQQIEENNKYLSNQEEFTFFCYLRGLVTDAELLFGKVSLWRISGHSQVKYHRDNYAYHSYIDRYVYNINMLNSQTDFLSEKNKIESEPGSIIKFDHKKFHSVKNNSDVDVYFLTFDLVKQNFISLLSEQL
jgi:hypothetical protein